MDDTTLFEVEDLNPEEIDRIVKEVYQSLEEKGYNAVNQLVGYIISGDPGYVSSNGEARTKIASISRIKLTEVILKRYLDQIK